MEEYLRHLHSFRLQLQEREAEEDALVFEEQKYRAAIAASEKDLEQVHAELNLNNSQLESIKRESLRLSDMILSCRKSLQRIDAESETLEHSFELWTTDIRNQVNAVNEKRRFYDAHLEGVISKKQEYENYYNSRPLESELYKVQVELEELIVTRQDAEPQPRAPSPSMATDEPEKGDKLEPPLEELETDLDALTAEYGREQEYLDSLKGHAEQLKVPKQIVCRHCGESFDVALQAALASEDAQRGPGCSSN